MSNFRPIHSRILIVRDTAEEKSPSGLLFIPDPAKEVPSRGTVRAAGPGRFNDSGTFLPNAVKAGDRVLFARYAGTEIEIDGVKCVVIDEGDVLGVIEDTSGPGYGTTPISDEAK